jgi:hypothetical protein
MKKNIEIARRKLYSILNAARQMRSMGTGRPSFPVCQEFTVNLSLEQSTRKHAAVPLSLYPYWVYCGG